MATSTHTRGSSDSSFGPQYLDTFDFTLRFEHTILTIIPASLLIVAFPPLLYQYTRRPVVVGRGWLSWAKIISAVCLLPIEISNLVLWTQQTSPYYSSVAIIASCLSCVAAGCIIAFLDIEHRHSLRASSLLSIYLTLQVILDATKARSCFSRNGDLNTIASLTATTAALKGFVVVLEEVSKRSQILAQQQIVGTEAIGGFWNRSLFLWVNKSLFLGFHKILELEDLDPLEPDFSAMHLNNKFSNIWEISNKESAHCLMKALLRSLSRPLSAVVIPRLCFTAFAYCQPFLLRRTIGYINEQDPSIMYSRGLIGATVLIYFGIAVSRAIYSHAGYRLVTFARGVLVSQILHKSLTISYAEASENAAISLMSTDIEALVTGLPELHNIWISFIEVAIGIYILTLVIGKASFLVALPLFLTSALSVYIGKRQGPARKTWNERIEYRVSQTIFFFQHIKGIKMLALDLPVSEYIQKLRIHEIETSKPFRLFSLMITTGAVFAESMTPVIVIGGAIFWAKASERFTAEEAFTTLAIIMLVSQPLLAILGCSSLFSSALGCVQRIQDFLLLPDLNDNRTRLEHNEDFDEKQEIFNNHAVFRARQLSIKDIDDTFLIYDASFSLQRSTVTVVTGSVGSGKSVLLRALLGEVQVSGILEVDLSDGIIAYCDQKPWLRNTSIRENIVNEAPFDLIWYETVLEACLLDEDLLRLPEGDETLAGSDGVSLSGGQKKRIALARALYSRAAIMILDDVMSGLDMATSTAILSKLFGSAGILRRLRTTVILTYHSGRTATFADKILHIEDGNVTVRMVPQVLARADRAFSPAVEQDPDAFSLTSIDESEEEEASTEEKANRLAVEEAQEDCTLRRKGDAALYSFYFRSTKAWLVVAWVLLLLLDVLAETFPSIYIRIWLEVAPENNLYFVGYAGLGCLGCILCAFMYWFFYYYVLPDSSNNLHLMLLKSATGATLSFLTDTDSGVILNKFSQDMSLVSQNLPRAILLVIYSASTTFATSIVVLSGAQYTATIVPLILLVLYAVQHCYLRTSRQMRYLDLEAKTPLYTHFSEAANGLYHLRSYGICDKVLQAGYELLDISQKPFYYMFCLQRWLTVTMDLTVLGVAVTLVSFGILLPKTSSQTAIGLSMVNLINLGELLSMVVETWTTAETSLGAIARIRAFVKDTPQEKDADGAVTPHPGWPQSGHIVVSNLTAAYSAIDVPQRVLHDVSLEVRPGQTAVLLGRTGSGKSSLILAILNFLDYTGSVYIDGLDISKVPRQTLRSQITTITQDAVELDGTVRYNLLPFKLKRSEGDSTIYDADAVDVLCRVRLWRHIASHGGLDASMRDLELSSGQKQLLCIARAILHNRYTGSKVVLMDEPTSSLDLDTDRYMQTEVFPEAFSHCAVLMIAHRLETIPDTGISYFIEMAEGRVVRVSRR